MNSTWLKIASGAIGILIIVVLISMFMPSGGNKEPVQPAESNKPTTFSAQVKKDENLLVKEEPSGNQGAVGNTQKPAEPNGAAIVPPVPEAPKKITIYAKPLNEIDQIEAERELNVAVPMLSIGRLPGPSFKNAVDSARRIISRWPDSIYAYKAKQLLAAVPESSRKQYNISAQETDTSIFLKSRAGTQPYTVSSEEP